MDPKQLLGTYDWKDSPFEITVHNREEHLEEEVDGVDQHRQQVKPCFARHHCEIDVESSIIGNISIAKQRISVNCLRQKWLRSRWIEEAGIGDVCGVLRPKEDRGIPQSPLRRGVKAHSQIIC